MHLPYTYSANPDNIQQMKPHVVASALGLHNLSISILGHKWVITLETRMCLNWSC